MTAVTDCPSSRQHDAMNCRPVLLLAIINLAGQVLVRAEVKRKIVQIPGDLVLGGLFPMHEQVIML